MNDFERWASPAVADDIARKIRRVDKIAEVILAVVIGLVGAVMLVRWWAE